MKNIYSILVTYEPNIEELNSAIKRLLLETNTLVICNNSQKDVVYEEDKVKIFNFRDNLGIAKAQSIGMEWAFSNGADFIIQMDQDSILEKGTVNKLLKSYQLLTSKGYKIGVLGPKHYDKETQEIDQARIIKGKEIDDKYSIINATISSSSLISKEAYLSAGGMEDDLFIDSVDFEYCWRLKTKGFITVRDNDVLLGHRVGDGKKKIIGKIDARIPSPIRHYYHIRNLFLLLFRGYVPFYWKVSNLFKLSLKIIIYPFLFDDGIKRVRYMLKGVKDGVLRKYGRIDLATRK